MNGRAGGGGSSSSLWAHPANPRSITFFLSLLLPIFVGLVMPAEAVPHSAVQRPQYIEQIRPVLPNSAMGGPLLSPQQMVVQQIPENVPPPRKRAAIVLDKLMFALQKALDENPNAAPPEGHPQNLSANRAFAAGPMDLQRRGNNDGRLYWRCYFNAVSCF